MPVNEARKHHYLPVFYQKRFADDMGLLWVYDRKRATYKRLHPRAVCCENDFYTIFSKDGAHLRTIETEFMSSMDGAAALALDKLAAQRILDSRSCDFLALFVGLQRTRLPSFRRTVSALIETNLDQFLRLGFSDVSRASQLIARYHEKTGDIIEQTPQALVEAVTSGAFTIKATETGFLQQMIAISQDLAQVVRQHKWDILEAPARSGFITCDDPLVTVPPSASRDSTVGIGIAGSTTYFPFTRRFCLCIQTPGSGIRFRKIGAFAAAQINKNIAANSDRFILCADMERLKYTVESSGSTAQEPDRARVDVAQSDANSALVRIATYRRRYFYY